MKCLIRGCGEKRYAWGMCLIHYSECLARQVWVRRYGTEKQKEDMKKESEGRRKETIRRIGKRMRKRLKDGYVRRLHKLPIEVSKELIDLCRLTTILRREKREHQ